LSWGIVAWHPFCSSLAVRSVPSRVLRLSVPLFLLTVAAGAQTATPIVWIDLVHADSDGTVVTKTTGCDGQDAGAMSQQQLSGEGYVEFTVGEPNTLWMAGLTHANRDTTYSDIDFGFRFNGAGHADVLEDGTYAGGETTYVPGDVFRVSVLKGRVEYSKNGRHLLTSTRMPVVPLVLDISLSTMGATVRNAVVATIARPPAGDRVTGTAARKSRVARP
jgi:hypothetical protein